MHGRGDVSAYIPTAGKIKCLSAKTLNIHFSKQKNFPKRTYQKIHVEIQEWMSLCLEMLNIQLFPTAIHLGDMVNTLSAVLSGPYTAVATVASTLMVFDKRAEIVRKIALVLSSLGCKK